MRGKTVNLSEGRGIEHVVKVVEARGREVDL